MRPPALTPAERAARYRRRQSCGWCAFSFDADPKALRAFLLAKGYLETGTAGDCEVGEAVTTWLADEIEKKLADFGKNASRRDGAASGRGTIY